MYIRIFILLISTMTIAFPLNINLGAFSPALVVGDGEISFAEGKQAEGLITSLAGSSAGTATAGENGLGDVKIKEGTKAPAAVKKVLSKTTEGDSDTKTNTTREISNNSSSQTEKETRVEESTSEQEELPEQSQKKRIDGALNRGPSIDLGTGEGGSGVGITIRPPGTAAPAAAEE